MLISYSVAACFGQLCGYHLSTRAHKSKITIAKFHFGSESDFFPLTVYVNKIQNLPKKKII